MTAQNSNARASKAYRDRMIALGNKQVTVWVPNGKQKDIQDLAKRLLAGG